MSQCKGSEEDVKSFSQDRQFRKPQGEVKEDVEAKRRKWNQWAVLLCSQPFSLSLCKRGARRNVTLTFGLEKVDSVKDMHTTLDWAVWPSRLVSQGVAIHHTVDCHVAMFLGWPEIAVESGTVASR